MTLRLADRLSTARQRRFVGRAGELALFQSTLTAAELPFYLLHIFGPGGVGKTTLLVEFAALCARRQIPAYYLDARGVEPMPEAFMAGLRRVMGLASGDSPIQALASRGGRQVILIDTYETL